MGKYALVDEESPEEEGLIPETRLEVSGMQYAVGEKVLLEEVSVVFQPRHLTALMGPSGAGKTTLMNVISGRAGGKILKKALIVREYKNGSYGAFAYWASRLTLASVSSACVAFVTPFIWWPLMGLPLNEPSRLFYTALATSITAASYASLASLAGLVMPDAVAAAQTAEPIISLLTLTGGTMLIRPQIKAYWMWLYYLNPLHYCYEIVVTQSFQGRHGSHKPQETLDYFHYSNGHMGANFTWLITIYIVIAAVGFIVVPRTFRH